MVGTRAKVRASVGLTPNSNEVAERDGAGQSQTHAEQHQCHPLFDHEPHPDRPERLPAIPPAREAGAVLLCPLVEALLDVALDGIGSGAAEQAGEDPANQPRRRRPVAVGPSPRADWADPPKTLSSAAMPSAIRSVAVRARSNASAPAGSSV